MRDCFVFVCLVALTSLAPAQQPPTPMQQPTMPAKFGEEARSGTPADLAMRDMFEAKIKVEWEALKDRDKKAYGELLADDYQGVEADGRGERNKIQAINELADTNVYNFTLFGFKLIPAGPDTAL